MTQPPLIATLDSDMAPVTEDALVESRALSRVELGHVSEKAFDLEATKRGWLVATHSGGGADFDFIIKKPHILRPVVMQVKKAHLIIDSSSSRHYKIRAGRRLYHRRGIVRYSETAFDILASHLSDIDGWVFYTRRELSNRASTTYSLPEHRKLATKFSAMDARDPNNWHLLDQVAESPIANQESLGVGPPLSYPHCTNVHLSNENQNHYQ